MNAEFNNLILTVIAYAVGPAVEKQCNQDLLSFYFKLIDEILTQNYVTEGHEILCKMNELIGEEYDCEIYELNEKADLKKFFAYRALIIVKCVFDKKYVLNEDNVSLSLFKQFNRDLDNLYIKKMRKGKTDSGLFNLLLKYDMCDSGEQLINISLEIIDSGNKIVISEICKSYRNALYRKLDTFN